MKRLSIGVLAVLVVASFGIRAIVQQRPYRDDTRELAQRALTVGAYADAERLAADWLERVETEHGPESQAVAQALDLLVEAQLKNGNAGTPGTLQLAERVVGLKARRLGSAHVDTARSLHNLGATHAQRGEFAAALQFHEQGLRIRSAALGRDDPAVADSLDSLALTLIDLERFQEAKERLDESQRIREHTSASPLALARTLELVGLLNRTTGQYGDAVQPIDRALAIRARISPDHPDSIFARQVRGDILLLMGDAAGAQQVWSSALSLGERALRPDHPAIAGILRRLGLAAFSLGNLADARRLRERALQIGEQSLAQCDVARAGLALAVGISLQYDGEYAESRKLYRRTLTTVRQCAESGSIGRTADVEATLVFNDAGAAREVGDLTEAEQLYERAVQTWSKGLGPDHPFVAKGLDALAEVAASRSEPAKAHALYERALAIRQRRLGAHHPQVAWTLTSLARTVADTGNVPLALRYVDEAIAIYEESGASDEPDHFARVLELRGSLEARNANLSAARASLVEALSERERIFGSAHPLAAGTRAAVADIDFARGASVAAFSAALEAEQAGLAHLRFTVRYLPERQAMAYSQKRPRGLDLALSIAAAGAVSDPVRLFDTVIQSRGAILDELAARSRAVNESDPKVAALNARVIAARQRFANLVVRSLQEPVPRALLDQARQQKEDGEQQLAEQSAQARAELARATTGVEGIRHALPSNAVLVSFVRYDRTPAPAGGPQTYPSRPVPSYAAFVIGSRSSETAFVPLGAAATLDGVVNAWRDEAAGGSFMAGQSAARAQQSYSRAAVRLRQAIWDPLGTLVGNATRIFIVPDGLLNVVSFAALTDRDGRYLAETTSVIHYLSTERDLVVPETRVVAPRMLLAVGGPAFDDQRMAPMTTSEVHRSGCNQLGGVRFDDLPGSLSEVVAIGKLWPAAGADDVTVLSGQGANEKTVKQALVGRRIVHLATHGFFIGSDCAPALAGMRAVGGVVPSSSRASVAAENPLLLAGLALARANRRSPVALDEDDGILTAEEIAGLNLQGTDWAVLSACDTGLGEIRAGEGVFGLRRAFQIAGARTVIMSLWAVEDRSAMVWMRALYEGRLQKNLNTADAVHAATVAVLRDRRANAQSTHPFYWAAFIAAGDWS